MANCSTIIYKYINRAIYVKIEVAMNAAIYLPQTKLIFPCGETTQKMIGQGEQGWSLFLSHIDWVMSRNEISEV